MAAIVEKIGLEARGRERDFTSLSVSDAGIWLALFASQSLLHGRLPIPEGLQQEIISALGSLGPDAVFLAKGTWKYSRRMKHYEPVRFDSDWDRRRHHLFFSSASDPLSPIDILEDGGIVGFNASSAFVFWVAEDD